MEQVERAVQAAILAEFRAIDQLGGVLSAVEYRYQRSQIQAACAPLRRTDLFGGSPIVGLNRYANHNGQSHPMSLVRMLRWKKMLQVKRCVNSNNGTPNQRLARWTNWPPSSKEAEIPSHN